MNDLISRNAVEHLIMTSNYDLGHPIQKGLMMHKIESIPSAESTGAMDEAIQYYVKEGYMELDRPIGEWILEDVQNKEDIENSNYSFRCSECGYVDIHSKCVEVPYCWHCGARMKKHE